MEDLKILTRRKTARLYYAANRKRILEYQKEYRKRGSVKKNKSKREKYQKDESLRKKYIEYSKNYRKENLEATRQYARQRSRERYHEDTENSRMKRRKWSSDYRARKKSQRLTIQKTENVAPF